MLLSFEILWNHLQLFLQIYLDTVRFKTQERYAVLLLSLINHKSRSSVLPLFLPIIGRPGQLNCHLKEESAACIQAITLSISQDINYNVKFVQQEHTPVT